MSPAFRRLSACVIASLVIQAAAAEENPVPAPTTAPSPTGPAVNATPTAPEAAPAPAPVATHAPERRTGVFGVAASLIAGYDSNILLEPDQSPNATDSSGAALGGDLKGTLRLVDREGSGVWSQGAHAERLSLSASAGLRDYPGNSTANQWRAGVQLAGHERRSFGDPGFVLGYNHYNIDHETAADTGNLDLYDSRVAPDYRGVDIVLVGGEYLRYPLDTNKTGEMGTLAYRHWFLMRPSDIHRRFEAGLAGSYYHAKATFETWYGVTPSLAAVWRVGNEQRLGTVDLSASLSYEYRTYGKDSAAPEAEHQGLFGVGGGADAWICPNSTIGVYAAYGHRESNFAIDTYSRFQGGARLAAVW